MPNLPTTELSTILNQLATKIEGPPDYDSELAVHVRMMARNCKASSEPSLITLARLVVRFDARKEPALKNGIFPKLIGVIRTAFLSAAPQSVRDELERQREEEKDQELQENSDRFRASKKPDPHTGLPMDHRSPDDFVEQDRIIDAANSVLQQHEPFNLKETEAEPDRPKVAVVTDPHNQDSIRVDEPPHLMGLERGEFSGLSVDEYRAKVPGATWHDYWADVLDPDPLGTGSDSLVDRMFGKKAVAE